MRTRKGILALLFVAALVLFGVTTVTASAVTKNHPKIPTCSITSVAGVWGHNLDGWVNQGVLTPIAAAGKMTVASNGAVSGTHRHADAQPHRPVGRIGGHRGLGCGLRQ